MTLWKQCLPAIFIAAFILSSADAGDPSVEQVKQGIAGDIAKGEATDPAVAISALDVVLTQSDNADERREALVLRGFFEIRRGDYEKAINDLKTAVRDEKLNPSADVPARVDGKWQLLRRSAAELLVEAYLHEAERDGKELSTGVLREARPYFQLAVKATRVVEGIEASKALSDGLLHDEKLVDLLLSADERAKIIAAVVEGLFEVDTFTEVVRVRHSKFACLALLRLAELVTEGAQDGGPAFVQLGYHKLTPAQLVLLAQSMPTATEPSHRRGMNFLAGQFEAAGASAVAARLRQVGGQPEQSALQKVAQRLFVDDAPDDARKGLEVARIGYERGLRTIRANLNPLQGGTVVVADPAICFNVAGMTKAGPPSFEREVVEMAAAGATESATLWALAFDGPEAQRVEFGDRAIRLAVEVESLVHSADWPGERPAQGSSAVAHLLKPYRTGLAIKPETAARFDRLTVVAEQFARSGMLSGAIGTRDSALRDFRIVYPDARSGLPGSAFDLWQSPAVRLNLTRAMIRHGHHDEAVKCLHELAKVAAPSEVLVIEAEYNRRNGRPQAAADEKTAIEKWKTLLGAANPAANDIRGAVGSLRGFMSREYREPVFAVVTGLGSNENDLRVLLDTLGSDRLPEFDEFLAGLLKSNFALRFGPPDPKANPAPNSDQLFAAIARSGGPKSVAELLAVYDQHCALSKPAPEAEGQPKLRPLSPLARYELFRQLAETIAALDIETAYLLSDHFFTHNPKFLDVPRPGGYTVRFSRGALRDPDGARQAVHPPTLVTQMTGRKYRDWLGHQARPRAVLQQAVTPIEPLTAAPPASVRTSPPREKWWEMDSTKKLEAAAAQMQQLRAAEKDGKADVLDGLIELGVFEGTVALGTLDLPTAQKKFAELSADLLKAKKDGKDIRLWVPYLPRPLSLKEAVALAELLDRQVDHKRYGPHLATLAAADALRDTSYLEGIKALQFFESAGLPTAGNWYEAWRFAEEFARFGNSGLAPQLAGPLPTATESTDVTVETRRRNIVGLQVGVRVPILAADKKTKQWVSPEEALAFLFGQIGSPAERFEAAYPAWSAQQAFGRYTLFPSNAFVFEFDTDRNGKPDKLLTVNDLGQRTKLLAADCTHLRAENDQVLAEMARIRRAHLFPLATAWVVSNLRSTNPPSVGDQYPLDNDLGVAACLHGDFAKAAEYFTNASQSDIGPGLLYRRMSSGGRLTRIPADGIETWSLAAPSGPSRSPGMRVPELAFALEAQRNLAYLLFLQGNFDDALAIMHKVHEVERRGAADRHPDAALRPLSLATFFGPDVVPLELAARALHESSDAMFRRDIVRAAGLVASLPAQFRSSPLATQLNLDIQLARLAEPREVLTKDKQQQLLEEAERLVLELSSRPLKGDPAFVKHPGWLIVHASIEDAMAKLKPTDSQERRRQESSARAKRLEAMDLVAKGLAVLSVPKGPTGQPAEWAVVYLEEAPRLLKLQAELTELAAMDKDPKFNVPNLATAYAPLLQLAIKKDAPADLAAAVLQPLARECSPEIEQLVLAAMTPETLGEAGAVDRFGLSRLDWLLAAVIRAGQSNGQSKAREVLIKLCEKLPIESHEADLALNALFALDPARATRITLDQLAKIPADKAEARLASVSANASRRQGVMARPRVSDTAVASWYADSAAFWYYPPSEGEVSFGDRLATMIGYLAASPQQLAHVIPELEVLIRRERLAEVDQLRPATGEMHSRFASVLSEAQFPAALALLLRYCDTAEDGPLAAARTTALKAGYAPLVAAPWLADPWSAVEPENARGKGQLGPRAWEHLRTLLPPRITINAPSPDSSFLDAIAAAIDDDVRRGVRTPVFKRSTESAVAGRIYNELRDAVLRNNDLSLPTNATPTDVNTFPGALEATLKTVTEAVRPVANARNVENPEAYARTLVNHEIESFTIRLWYVANRYAGEGRAIGELGLADVTTEFEILAARKLAAEGVVETITTSEPITGDTTEYYYRPELVLVKRRLYLPKHDNEARYEEVFRTSDGTEVVLRGSVPVVYYGPLTKHTRLLDVLDISLAKRATLLMNPLGPIHLSLDMALLDISKRAPHAAWPALIQNAGAPDINTYLTMCTRDQIPTTTYEFVQQVAPQTLQATDVDGRMQAQEVAHQRMYEAYFNQSYAGRAMDRAKGINDTIRTKLFGIAFLTIRETPNESKRMYVGSATQRAAQAAAFHREKPDIDLFSLCDPSDPARYILVIETGFSADGKKWICRYRIGTVLGRSVYYEASGEVAKLPDVLQYLIALNPGLVRKLPIDLGGLTADPMMQVALALNATAQIAGGPNSVIAEMNRHGLTPEGMKRAMEIDLALFPGSNKEALEVKHKRYKELYARAFPESRDTPSLGGEPAPALKSLLDTMDAWKKKLESQGVSQADEVAKSVIANSHDIDAWGIPGVVCLYIRDGKVIDGDFVITLKFGSTGSPNGYSPNPEMPSYPRLPEYRPNYPQGPVWGNVDPRSGYEVPRRSNDPATREIK